MIYSCKCYEASNMPHLKTNLGLRTRQDYWSFHPLSNLTLNFEFFVTCVLFLTNRNFHSGHNNKKLQIKKTTTYRPELYSVW